LNQREPKPQGDLYAAAEWMSDTQREGWHYAITNAPHGLLKHLDRSMPAIWVAAEDLHREAAEKITQYGLLTRSPHAGLPLQSPYLAILNKQAQIMLKAGAELGFSPSSRSRVQVDGLSGPLAWLRDRDSDPDGLLAKPWDNRQANRTSFSTIEHGNVLASRGQERLAAGGRAVLCLRVQRLGRWQSQEK
jgi:P27 family predicted phage terminase small subunit